MDTFIVFFLKRTFIGLANHTKTRWANCLHYGPYSNDAEDCLKEFIKLGFIQKDGNGKDIVYSPKNKYALTEFGKKYTQWCIVSYELDSLGEALKHLTNPDVIYKWVVRVFSERLKYKIKELQS